MSETYILEKKFNFRTFEIIYSSYCNFALFLCRKNASLPSCHSTEVSSKTAVDFYALFRKTCSWVLQNSENCEYRFGGPANIIQIDESVVAKRKYNHGRMIKEKWIFGGYDPDKKFGFLEFVEDRGAETVLEVIYRRILPGTKILSGGWSSYIPLSRPRPVVFLHEYVDHSKNFKDPITGVHTNNIEAMWGQAKKNLKAMNGVIDLWLPAHLDDFLWSQRSGSAYVVFDNLLFHVKLHYTN